MDANKNNSFIIRKCSKCHKDVNSDQPRWDECSLRTGNKLVSFHLECYEVWKQESYPKLER